MTRRQFVGGLSVWLALPVWARGADVKKRAKKGKGGFAPWETADGLATPNVMVRRLCLDLAGRLPSPAEARAFVAGEIGREAFVDRLLASEDFADYWSMRLCDLLRVKSEFPINLWPNAVYVYHRFLREAVKADEPWDALAAKLVTGSGSDFRDPEANFIRASADRSPEGLARTAVRTFLDDDLDAWPADERRRAVAAFSNVRVKHTREWKEELVCSDGPDRRGEFVKLLEERRERFAAAAGGYVGHWFFGRRGPDEELGRTFAACGFRLKALCRSVVLSDAYARGAVTGGFPLRRLDAEVLEDALCSLAGMKRAYRSIAPEPFTFIPPDRKTVLLEDGSIVSGFTTLFGRPPRDSGLPEERRNAITAKQRLYLFNSGRLYRALSRLRGDVAGVYWKFCSRPPTAAERAAIREAGAKPGEVAWCLMNSREFLYRG